MGKSMGIGKSIQKVGNDLGQKIGAGYAEQGKAWGEIASMPSSGSSPMSKAIQSSPMSKAIQSASSSGVKSLYNSYMANNKPAFKSTSSASMLQTPSVGGDGLAASAAGTAQQPTLTSGVQIGNLTPGVQIGNLTNGLGFINGLAGSSFRDNYQNYQGKQNQYGIIDGARII